jgi:hypothetical protein
MRAFPLIFLMFGLSACATRLANELSASVAAPSAAHQQPDSSIEDYILALPAYSFHEEDVASFTARVKGARALPQNKNKGSDYLYVPGDGCWPAKEIMLERSTQRLTIQFRDGRGPGAVPYTTTMRRVSSGWLLEAGSSVSPRFNLDTRMPVH